MARTARLIALLALAVLLAHALLLDRCKLESLQPRVLRPMAAPMLTRVLQPEAPPAVAAAPAPAPAPPATARALPRPSPRAGDAVAAPSAPLPPTPTFTPPPAVVVAEAPAAPALPTPPSPFTLPASAAASSLPLPTTLFAAPPPTLAASGTAAGLDSWPADTRLSYQLSGQYRGPLYGSARVQWQRRGGLYEARVEIDVRAFANLALTSHGVATPGGLRPRAYEEDRNGKRRGVVLGEDAITFEGGRREARPAGVQDTASQFVELSHRFATGRSKLEVGQSVTFWMSRPGDVDEWTYDVVERVMLPTPRMGDVEAFHLKPRPLARPRGNITAEMWFAPSLKYLPVRIRVNMGSEVFVDLLVEKIEQ